MNLVLCYGALILHLPHTCNDMKSHTGNMLTFNKEAMFFMSNKQKVNSTSSVVAEIIRVDCAINFVLLVELFIEWQVETVPIDSILKRL